MCNGPNEDRDTVELMHGKGMVSSKLYKKIQSVCAFDETAVEFDSATAAPEPSVQCEALLEEMDKQVGPYNIYNVYDNCPSDGDDDDASGLSQKDLWHRTAGKSSRFINKYLHMNAHRFEEAKRELDEMGGGEKARGAKRRAMNTISVLVLRLHERGAKQRVLRTL